jgi:hypothetical protein
MSGLLFQPIVVYQEVRLAHVGIRSGRERGLLCSDAGYRPTRSLQNGSTPRRIE